MTARYLSVPVVCDGGTSVDLDDGSRYHPSEYECPDELASPEEPLVWEESTIEQQERELNEWHCKLPCHLFDPCNLEGAGLTCKVQS